MPTTTTSTHVTTPVTPATPTTPAAAATGAIQGRVHARPALLRCGAAAMALSSLLLFVGAAIHPKEADDAAAQAAIIGAASNRWLIAHIILLLGACLLAGAFPAITRPLRALAPRTAMLTTLAGIAGAFGLFGLFTTEGLGSWAVSRSGTSTEVGGALDELKNVAIGFGIVSFLQLAALVAIGIAFWGTAPALRVHGSGLALGAVMVFVAMVGGVDVFGFVGTGLLVLSMSALAYRDLTIHR